MRLPDPIANTTTEAYLAYKAGVLAEGDLKPKLYEPYIHLDAWLAYWTGLTTTYPVKNVGKNLFNGNTINAWLQPNGTPTSSTKDRTSADYIPVTPNTSYVLHGTLSTYLKFTQFDSSKTAVSQQTTTSETSLTVTTGPTTYYVRIGWGNADKGAADVILERGSTATAYEPYTGEPEMLTDEEAYIAYLSGVTDTYPEEFRDPADIRVAAYLRYLISARFGRPEYPVTNEELYLSMLKTQYIPSGDPSSDITIDGTAKAAFVDVKMYGDTYQQSYEGWNILDVDFKNTTSCGVTKTLNADKTITLNGKINEGLNFTFGKDITFDTSSQYTLKVEVLRGSSTPYTNDGLPKHQWGVMVYMGAPSLGWQGYAIMCADDVTTVTFTPAQATGTPRFWFGYNASTTDETTGIFNDYTLRISVKKGTTISGYEPYVGGIPSPNPDYPQPIQTVTGRQVVSVTGKNLYRSNNQTTTWNGASVMTDGSEITFTGNSGGNSSMSYIRQEIPISIPSGTTLTVSAKTVSGEAWGSGAFRVGIRLNYSDGTNSNLYIPDYYPSAFGTTKSTTITTSKDVTSMAPAGLSYDAKGITNPVTFVCQLEKGSTATAYEPYSSNDYEINLGKNLLDTFRFQNYSLNGVQVSIGVDGSIILNGTSTASGNIRADVTDIFKNRVGEQLTYSVETSGTGLFSNFGLKTPNGTISGNVTPTAPTRTVTLEESSTGLYIADVYFNGGKTFDNFVMKIQIEAGSTATTYAPYFTPIELCKLGDYQDYIYKDGEEWKIHKNTSRFTFKTRKLMGLSKQNLGFVYNTGSNPLLGKYIPLVGKCSHFDIEPTTTAWTGLNKTGMNSGGALWFMTANTNQGDTRTIDEFGQWLVDAGVSFVYALETPTDTTITNQALIDQLEALVSGGAENGTTYIKVDATDPNLPGLIYVEAPKYD